MICSFFAFVIFCSYTLDEFSNARRAAVVRSFIDALTRGGPGGTPRPIELHSHDPLRYLGDMLAWGHQATASEEGHRQARLKKCTKIRKYLLIGLPDWLCLVLLLSMDLILASVL